MNDMSISKTVLPFGTWNGATSMSIKVRSLKSHKPKIMIADRAKKLACTRNHSSLISHACHKWRDHAEMMKRKAKETVKALDVSSSPLKDKKKKKEETVRVPSHPQAVSPAVKHVKNESPDTKGRQTIPPSPKGSKLQAPNSEKDLVSISSPSNPPLNMVPVTSAPVQSPSPSSSPSKTGPSLPLVQESPNQVQVFVHRFRSAHHIPRTIIRLAATPYMPGYLSYVALSREGGALELISVDEHSKCVSIVEGLKDRHVDALVWLCGHRPDRNPSQYHNFLTSRRLFGASRDGTIFEVDFYTKSLRHVMESGGGAVFCLASPCPCENPCSCQGFLAAGCEDGTIRIYQAANVLPEPTLGSDVGLTLVTILPSASSAVLSLAWMKHPGRTSLVGSTLVAGMADGTIRKFESSTHACRATHKTGKEYPASTQDDESIPLQWTATIRITVENRGRSMPTKIWAIKILDDGTIVSGDSLGNVQFWDGQMGTMIQSFEHSKADVLDIAVSRDQTKVMACGMDPKVICIARESEAVASGTTGSKRKWIVTCQLRRHSHDVNSLALVYKTDPSGCAGMSLNRDGLAKTSKPRELLFSGGVDTKICSYFVSDMRKYRPRIVYKYPSVPNISLARTARFLTIMRSDRIDFFKLADKRMKPKIQTDSKVLNGMESSIGSVVISSVYNLSCSDISNDGSVLAVGNAAGLLLFSMNYPPTGGILSSAIPALDAMDFSCSLIKFIPGSSKRFACCTSQGDIRIIKIQQETDREKDVTCSACEEYALKENKGRGSYSHLAVSTDGQWLASASYNTASGIVHVFSISKDFKHWWTLPATEAPISCLKFLGGYTPVLFIGCNNYAFYIYDIERRTLSDFSQDLGFPMSPLLPHELNHRTECPSHVTQNPTKVNQFFMGDSSLFCAIDLDSPMPQHCSAFPSNHILAKLLRKQCYGDIRKVTALGVTHDADEPSVSLSTKRKQNFTLCLKYSGIIFMEFLDDDELLLVEQPWLAILNALPDVLECRRYGD